MVIAISAAIAPAKISIDLDLCPAHPRFSKSVYDVAQSAPQSLPLFTGGSCSRKGDRGHRSPSFAKEFGR